MSRIALSCLFTATLSLAACATPAPVPDHPVIVPHVDESPSTDALDAAPSGAIVPDRLVAIPTSIDCDRPITFQLCPNREAACVAHQLKVNHYQGRWHFACQPITPADPIAGERVGAVVAGKPESLPLRRDEETCGDPAKNRPPVVHRRQDGTLTVFQVKSTRDAACRGGADTYGVSLGVLEAGRYEVRTAYGRHRFTVRPRGSDPGTFEPGFVVRLRIAAAQRIGECSGMPPCPNYFFEGFETSRASNRMARLFPQREPHERQRIFRTASAVILEPTGPSTWNYAYTSDDTCSRSEIHGQVSQSPDGSVTIGPPQVSRTQLIPC